MNEHRKCYQYKDGELEYDEGRKATVQKEEKQTEISELRGIICFPVINRGWLWYQNLTEQQIDELSSWYKAWLDAPQTMIIPKNLTWI